MITLMSFGFKYGHPPCNYYFDVSFIKNPAREEQWDLFAVVDNDMVDFVMRQDAARHFVSHACELILFLAKQDDDFRVGIGCSSGRHRSFIIAEQIAMLLDRKHLRVDVKHREVEFHRGRSSSDHSKP